MRPGSRAASRPWGTSEARRGTAGMQPGTSEARRDVWDAAGDVCDAGGDSRPCAAASAMSWRYQPPRILMAAAAR